MEEETVQAVSVPVYRTMYTEMPIKLFEQIVVLAAQSIQSTKLEKEACKELIKKLSENNELENLG